MAVPANKTRSANNTVSAEREAKVSALALAHVPQRDIARQLGLSKDQVWRTVRNLRKRWRDESRAEVEELMVQELASLSAVESRMWTQFTDRTLTPDEKTRTGLAILRVKERRAKMLGWDSPEAIRLLGASDDPIVITLQIPE